MRSVHSALRKYLEGKRGGQSKQQNVENSRPRPGCQLLTPENAWGSSREDGPLPSPHHSPCTLETIPVAFPSPLHELQEFRQDVLTPPCFARSIPPATGEKGQGKRRVSLSSGCPLPGLHSPRPRENLFLAVAVATGSAQSLGQRAGGQDGKSPRFSLLEGSGELDGPCPSKRLPPNVQF